VRKTPVEILKESGGNISPQVFNLPPIILDNYLKGYIKTGYYVKSSDKKTQKNLTIFLTK
jgi:hypothetical protein